MEERLKLLVVDDEPDNLDLLYRTFRRDYKVFKAKSGAEALELLDAQGEMAIIISDQRMPKMNGTEFLSRTVERFPDTIRMVLTGYTDVEDLVSAINSGKVFKYITKPWNPKKLKDVIVQAGETYRVIKQRTHALSRSLRQESLSNSIMAAVRGSLDYGSTLQTIVSAVGKAFDTDFAVLYPVEILQGVGSDQALPTYQPYSTNTLNHTASESLLGESPENSPLVAVSSEINVSEKSATAVVEAPPLTLNLFSNLEALPPLPCEQVITSDVVTIGTHTATRIVVPFLDQTASLATLCLYRTTRESSADQQWASDAVDLLKNVSEQVSLAIVHAKLYQQIHRQTVQMRAELDVARKIQSNLLHQSWPDTPGLKIQARCQPAREVGGDFFEVFMHPQGDIWLAVGDVSGKGVPAALFMASAISVLRRELAQEKSPEPDKVMSNLNHSLSNDLMSNNCFITMALIRYSEATRELVYANAGHVYPVVWSHKEVVAKRESSDGMDNVEPKYLDVRGVPLGILPAWKATSGTLQLADGDVVLLTSDGITEATVPNRKNNGSCSMLNQDGLWEFLQQQPADLNLDSLLS
ncbi:MAG: SpoIIE family protein phosphatase, partial [Cyanobacteria bacterium J06632_3]